MISIGTSFCTQGYIFSEAATTINPQSFFQGHMGRGTSGFSTLMDAIPLGPTLRVRTSADEAAASKLRAFEFLSFNRDTIPVMNECAESEVEENAVKSPKSQ